MINRKYYKQWCMDNIHDYNENDRNLRWYYLRQALSIYKVLPKYRKYYTTKEYYIKRYNEIKYHPTVLLIK